MENRIKSWKIEYDLKFGEANKLIQQRQINDAKGLVQRCTTLFYNLATYGEHEPTSQLRGLQWAQDKCGLRVTEGSY